MLFRTKDIIENNLFFDEIFFLYYSDDDLCRRVKKIKKFIREYNLAFDRYYYFFKINKHLHIINEYKKKIPLFIVKFFLKILTFNFLSSIELLSKYYAYHKFKSKILKKKL
jgi:hypothetical protein